MPGHIPNAMYTFAYIRLAPDIFSSDGNKSLKLRNCSYMLQREKRWAKHRGVLGHGVLPRPRECFQLVDPRASCVYRQGQTIRR